jgi:capsule polysaccharide export protein KpsE/RkpR
MGAIEDTRKVLQDFLAPEMRELKARLDALEKRMDERFNQVDERFKAGEQSADLRHAAVMAEFRGLSNYHELRERIAKLESSREAVHQ